MGEQLGSVNGSFSNATESHQPVGGWTSILLSTLATLSACLLSSCTGPYPPLMQTSSSLAPWQLPQIGDELCFVVECAESLKRKMIRGVWLFIPWLLSDQPAVSGGMETATRMDEELGR